MPHIRRLLSIVASVRYQRGATTTDLSIFVLWFRGTVLFLLLNTSENNNFYVENDKLLRKSSPCDIIICTVELPLKIHLQ